MTRFFVAVMALTSVMPALAGGASAAEIVRQYFEAYNAHDVAASSALVHDDIGVYGVNAGNAEAWSSGKEALSAMLQANFDAIASTRSEIVSETSVGNFVSLVEKALWDVAGETREQCSLSVYEVRDGLLANVWYFSEQPCPTEE